jgi:hypothetical protein
MTYAKGLLESLTYKSIVASVFGNALSNQMTDQRPQRPLLIEVALE